MSPKKSFRLALMALAVAAAAACQGDSIAPDYATMPLRSYLKTTLEAGVTADEQKAEIARRIPGFAGIYYDEQGMLFVRLKNDSRLAEARAAVIELLTVYGAGELDPKLHGDILRMRASDAQYDFAELQVYFNKIINGAAGLSSVITIDISERLNRVVVGIEKQDDLQEVQEAIRRDGVPLSAVMYDVTGPIGRPEANLADSIRPVAAGHKIENDYYWNNGCSIGFNLRHMGTNGSYTGGRYFVTASHCTPTLGGLSTPVDTMGQSNQNQYIGFEVSDPAFQYGTSGCPSGRKCRRSDAALYEYLPNVNDLYAYLPWPSSSGGTSYSSTKEIYGMSLTIDGETVYKLGYSGGLRSGTVYWVCQTVMHAPTDQEYYALGIRDSMRSIVCANRANYLSQGGDSGGAVVRVMYDGRLAALGIHFQGPGAGDPLGLRVYSGWWDMDDELDDFLGGGGFDPTVIE